MDDFLERFTGAFVWLGVGVRLQGRGDGHVNSDALQDGTMEPHNRPKYLTVHPSPIQSTKNTYGFHTYKMLFISAVVFFK